MDAPNEILTGLQLQNKYFKTLLIFDRWCKWIYLPRQTVRLEDSWVP